MLSGNEVDTLTQDTEHTSRIVYPEWRVGSLKPIDEVLRKTQTQDDIGQRSVECGVGQIPIILVRFEEYSTAHGAVIVLRKPAE